MVRQIQARFERLLRSQCCICLIEFSETEIERTQEFTLRWSAGTGTGTPSKQIVRQQWNFSPHGSTREIEDYQVSLENVSLLELMIKPGGNNSLQPCPAPFGVNARRFTEDTLT